MIVRSVSLELMAYIGALLWLSLLGIFLVPVTGVPRRAHKRSRAVLIRPKTKFTDKRRPLTSPLGRHSSRPLYALVRLPRCAFLLTLSIFIRACVRFRLSKPLSPSNRVTSRAPTLTIIARMISRWAVMPTSPHALIDWSVIRAPHLDRTSHSWSTNDGIKPPDV